MAACAAEQALARLRLGSIVPEGALPATRPPRAATQHQHQLRKKKKVAERPKAARTCLPGLRGLMLHNEVVYLHSVALKLYSPLLQSPQKVRSGDDSLPPGQSSQLAAPEKAL